MSLIFITLLAFNAVTFSGSIGDDYFPGGFPDNFIGFPSLQDDPCTPFYLISAYQYSRPMSTYCIAITWSGSCKQLDVVAKLTGSMGKYVAIGAKSIPPKSTSYINLKIGDWPDDKYVLTIQGSNGLEFKDTRIVIFINKKASAFIQTDKSIYQPEQKVNFRLIVIDSSLKPYSLSNITLTIKDAKQNYVFLESGIELVNGIYSGSFELSDKPNLGKWIISTKILDKQIAKVFSVEEYVLPKFQVSVIPPASVPLKDRSFKLIVEAKYTYNKPLEGRVIAFVGIQNCGTSAKCRTSSYEADLDQDGRATIKIFLTEIDRLKYENYDYYRSTSFPLTMSATAIVEEQQTRKNQSNSATFKVTKSSTSLSISTEPSKFKSGLPLVISVQLLNYQGNPFVNPDPAYVNVSIITDFDFDEVENRTVALQNDGSGQTVFNVPDWITRTVAVYVNYKDIHDIISFTPAPAQGRKQIIINKPKNVPNVGDIQKFKISATFLLTSVTYLITGRGKIIETKSINFEETQAKNVDIEVRITHEMTPSASIVITVLNPDGELITDGINIDVNGFMQTDVKLKVVPNDVKPNTSVDICVETKPMSFVALSAVDQSVVILKSENGLDNNTLLKEFSLYNGESATLFRTYSKGVQPVFDEANLVYFTNSLYDRGGLPSDGYDNILERVKGKRFSEIKSFFEAVSKILKVGSSGILSALLEDKSEFKGLLSGLIGGLGALGGGGGGGGALGELLGGGKSGGGGALGGVLGGGGGSGLLSMMDGGGGKSLNLIGGLGGALGGLPSGSLGGLTGGLGGGLTYNLGSLLGGISGSGLSEDTGDLAAVLRKNFPETWLWEEFYADKNGWANKTFTAPDTITSWIIKAIAMNNETGLGISNDPATLRVFRPFFISLNLPYSIVRREKLTIQALVFNYLNKDLSVDVTMNSENNEFKFLDGKNGSSRLTTVDIKAGKSASVYFAVQAMKIGNLIVNISAISKSKSVGDIINQQLLVKAEGTPIYFNTPVFIALKKNDKFSVTVDIDVPNTTVPDSTRIDVFAIGDVFGLVLNNLDNLIRMPYGCGEQNMINLVPDILVLDYLEIVKRSTPAIRKRAIEFMKYGYQRELSYRRNDGSFSIFGSSDLKGSTWLTAFVVKTFIQAKRYITIDDKVILDALKYLASKQNGIGLFKELGSVHDSYLKGGSYFGVALTAYVLIAIEETKINDSSIVLVKKKAMDYLESKLNETTDKYTIPVLTYALHVSKSSKAPEAFKKLTGILTSKGFEKYIEVVKSKYLKSYCYYCTPTLNTEATAYALLTFVYLDNLNDGMPLMRWLINQRNEYGGFSSTQDTAIGLEALAKATAKLPINEKDSLDISFTYVRKIAFTAPKPLVLTTNSINAIVLQSRMLPPAINNVTISANGSGMALVQVAWSYNVLQTESSKDFTLNVKITTNQYGYELNVCTRFINKESKSSNMAIVEVIALSGYAFDRENSPDKLDSSNIFLVELEDQETTMNVYFDQISSTETCFQAFANKKPGITVENLKPAPITVYDYYKPEVRLVVNYKPAA